MEKIPCLARVVVLLGAQRVERSFFHMYFVSHPLLRPTCENTAIFEKKILRIFSDTHYMGLLGMSSALKDLGDVITASWGAKHFCNRNKFHLGDVKTFRHIAKGANTSPDPLKIRLSALRN